jgi:hypothetical protein
VSTQVQPHYVVYALVALDFPEKTLFSLYFGYRALGFFM